ncbi:MAG: hypothetical protein LBF36_03610 [Mycoplasmataceae bacterium]|jgi:hypothetical protein|nr:hypothetical protein [Mycoplasmataceae bacterium]
MKNNDPIFNFLKLHGYVGKKLQDEYNKLKKDKITLQQLINRFIKTADTNPNAISCNKCIDKVIVK